MIVNKANMQNLFTSFNMAFKEGLGVAPGEYERVSMTIPSSTSENVYPWLGKLPGMREWIGDRIVHNLSLYDYSIKNKTFETTVSVRQEDIEDDQFGMYSPLFRDLGAQASIHPNQLVFGALKEAHKNLCFDGKPYFAKDHPVGGKGAKYSNLLAPDKDAGEPWYLMCTTRPIKPIIFQRRKPYELKRMDSPTDENVFMRAEYVYGVQARVNVGYGLWQLAVRCTKPLDSESYNEARTLMAGYKDENGNPLGLIPNLVVVPPTLEGQGRRVLVNAFGANGATNEWAGSAELLVTPWLAA